MGSGDFPSENILCQKKRSGLSNLHLVFAAHVLHHPDVHDGAVAEAGEPAHEDADEEDGVGGGEGGGGAHLHQSAITIVVT